VRKYLVRNRLALESAVLAHVLPFAAGAVNASGFFIVGVYTSHVTGAVARMGDDLAQGDLTAALDAGLLVACFFLGALSATSLFERARRRNRAHYATAIAAEAATLTAVTLLGLARPGVVSPFGTFTAALLCLAMGMQNALVTTLSGAIVRTTHLTGVVTDMGIETVRAALWLRRAASERGARAALTLLFTDRQQPELVKLRLHLAIFVSFFVGAVVGPWLYLHHGFVSMLLPIGVLLLLIAFDLAVGFRTREPHEAES
jgi:uncharacterized membrane protein YoaK (UPF0700 family)